MNISRMEHNFSRKKKLLIYASDDTFLEVTAFLNWDSHHAKLNSHYQICSYKKKKQKISKCTGNLFQKNLQLKVSANSRFKGTQIIGQGNHSIGREFQSLAV